MSGVLALSLILVACNDSGGGPTNSGNTARPFASNSTPLSSPSVTPDELSQDNVATGITVTGNTSTISDVTISVIDSDDTPLFFDLGNEKANYSVTLPLGTSYPVMITATNGVDLVTGLPPVISMVSVIKSPADTIANINPFTTLIVKTAQAMPGGLNPGNLDMASQYIVTALNFGLDVVSMPDPIAAPVTALNIASVVKAGQALTETIYRSTRVINLAGGPGGSIDENSLLDALAADMVDGKSDGIGAVGADPFLSAVMNVVSAQVLLEALSNNLLMDGLPIAAGMDSAIQTIFPTVLSGTSDLVISGEMIAHTKLVIHAAQSVIASDDNDLSAIISAIASLDANMLPADVGLVLSAFGNASFDPAINTLVTTTDSTIYQSVLSAFSDAHQHRLVTLAWSPSAEVDGYIIHAGPTPSTATAKVSVVATALVELDAQADLGLNSGDDVCFRIKAFNTSGVSDFSGAVCTVI